MLDVTTRGGPVARLRIGLAVDYFEGPILRAIAPLPRARTRICGCRSPAEPSSALLRDLRRGDYDLVVAASDTEQPESANRRWLEPSGWGAASAAVVQGDGPGAARSSWVRAACRAASACRRSSARGQDYQIVHVAGSFAGLVQGAAAGLGVACWARRCLLEAGLQVLEGVPRLPAVADVMAASICGKASTSRRSSELADHDRGGGRRGDRCGLSRSRAASCELLNFWVRQSRPCISAACVRMSYPCAKPERCAQPVMRASSIAISAYITMPSTASASRPAKISGT